MKPLIPSHKENKRYLLISGKNLRENVEKAILEFVGILGLSQAGLSFVKLEKDSAIISINRKALNSVRGAFVLFPDKIIVKKVSGTLRGLSK